MPMVRLGGHLLTVEIIPDTDTGLSYQQLRNTQTGRALYPLGEGSPDSTG